MRALTVTNAFGSFAVGETITGNDAIEAALESNPGHVVAFELPDEPEKPGKGKPASDAPASAPTPSTGA